MKKEIKEASQLFGPEPTDFLTEGLLPSVQLVSDLPLFKWETKET